MPRNAAWYLNYLVNEIHRTVVSTLDDDGLPVTAAIDMMMADESGLYFLTARGKNFYDRLVRQKFLALTGTKGNGTMSSVAISVRGKVREEGPSRLDELLEHNPYMYDIYPTPASREVLTVFKVYEGTGEWFDLSVKPIDRASFAFGGATEAAHGYFVNAASCIGCGACLPVCPQQCIARERRRGYRPSPLPPLRPLRQHLPGKRHRATLGIGEPRPPGRTDPSRAAFYQLLSCFIIVAKRVE